MALHATRPYTWWQKNVVGGPARANACLITLTHPATLMCCIHASASSCGCCLCGTPLQVCPTAPSTPVAHLPCLCPSFCCCLCVPAVLLQHHVKLKVLPLIFNRCDLATCPQPASHQCRANHGDSNCSQRLEEVHTACSESGDVRCVLPAIQVPESLRESGSKTAVPVIGDIGRTLHFFS